MAFKKITIIKQEPAPIKDPAQLDLEDLIARVKATQPTDINVGQLRPDIVNWETDERDMYLNHYKLDVMYNQVGSVYVIGRFNPFSENNFCLWIKSDQTDYANRHGYYRVILLNEDLSPKLGPNADQVIQMIEGYKLDYTGIIAIGEMHL